MEYSKVKRNIKAFDGEKYSVWKFRIKSLLAELDVIKVVDDDIPLIPGNEWQKAERIAKSIIVEYLSDSFLGFAKTESTAKDILQSLDVIYERKSLATQLALRKKLLGLKLQCDTPLIKHFTMFDDLITELLAAGAKLEETDKVSHLLLTMPNSYDGVITAIETLSENNLTLAFVKTRLLDHEVKLSSECRDTSAKVLQVGNISDAASKSNFKIKQRQFYRKGNNKFKSYNKSYSVKCHHCGRYGHIKSKCYYLKRQQYNNNKNTERMRTVQTVQLNQPESIESSGFAFMAVENEYQKDTDKNKIIFILDSGASDHIINRKDLSGSFVDLQPPVKISVAKNGTFIAATKKGSLNLVSNMGIQGVLENVLYCPEIPYNLISVPRMQNAGLTVIFDESGVKINKGGKTIIKGKPLNNLIAVDFKVDTHIASSINHIINYEIWHQRLGHIGKNKFLELKNKQMINDIGQIDKITPNDGLCEACISGKQTRLPFNRVKDKNHITRPLFIIHSDVCGPITPPTIDNKNYFVVFVDEYTHYCVTYLITHKSNVFSVFKDFEAKSQAHFNLKIVNLYIDNGREYLSNEMKDYCVEKGISYHLTVPRTPQLNGVSERMNRTITEKARAMIVGASIGKVFWGEAVLTATYLINLTPTKALKQLKTPYELWHNKKPQIKYLKVFGSTVYVHNKISKTKFDERTWKGILVGYEANGYKVWDVETEKCIIARDVIVDEMHFLKTRPKMKGVGFESSCEKTDVSEINSNSVEGSSACDKTDVPEINSKSVVGSNSRYKTDVSEINSNSVKGSSACDKTDVPEINSKSVVGSNKSGRNKSDGETKNRHTGESESQNNQTKQIFPEPRRSDRIKSRMSISYNENTIDDYIMCAQSIICKIPTSYEEIKNRDDRVQWEQAIKEEINSLLVNNTWTLIKRPENKNIVDCKWVFAIKNDEFGNPLRYKARLVAKGFTQEYLEDYNETFAPVARISSFRFIVAFANQFNLLIHHMDVKTAFLNGNLKEEIYMKVPQGVIGKENQVCKLNKALYGLKQAARCWFEIFEQTIKEKGFKNSSVDRCIYILDKGNISKNIYVVLYVDDLVIATENIRTMHSFKNYLMNKFAMVDLKDIKLFLGIRIKRVNDIITLDQNAYIETVLNKFNMNECKAVSTPLENKVNFIALNSDEKYDAPCRNLIGCLMYVMICTRPDLSIAVNILSRYMNKNNKELWICLKRVLRYLKGSKDLKLTYIRNDYKIILSGYVDSDWGGNDNSDRKSTTGYLFILFEKCTICWGTKRQVSVAASSTEAEYMALYEAVKEALWLKSLSTSINMNIEQPIIIYEDNNGCISIANNPSSHKRSKHIDIKYHFSREQVEKNVIKLNYVSTDQQLADALTKPLPAAKFVELRTRMGLE